MSSVLYADNSAKDENGSYAELAWKWVMQLYNVHYFTLYHQWIFKQIWAAGEKWNWLGLSCLVQDKEAFFELSDQVIRENGG